MWRRFGDAAYAVLVLLIFTIEAVGLAALTWAFLLRRSGLATPTFGVKTALVLAVGATALALTVLTVYTVAYQVVSTRRQRRYTADMLIWSDRWIDVVFSGELPPPPPLPQAAVDALLDLRESVRGDAAQRVQELVSAYGIDTELINRVRGSLARHLGPVDGPMPTHKEAMGTALTPGSFAKRLDALDGLARARSPIAVPTLMLATRDPDPAVRLMATRALARSASAIENNNARETAAQEIVELLHTAQLGGSALGEALQLLDAAAPYAVARILADPQRYGHRFVCAALDAIGRLGLTDFVHIVVGFADNRRVSIRAAAVRSLAELGRIPHQAQRAIRLACHDRNESVRLEAARAARLLEGHTAIRLLKPMLDDHAWSVRRVAAASLAAVGDAGRQVLTETALEHHDPHARSVASQVLVESRAFIPIALEGTA